MKLTDLELCKKVAEIEGYSSRWRECLFLFVSGKDSLLGGRLLLDLMFKHEVVIDWHEGGSGCTYIVNRIEESFVKVEYKSKPDLPRAILECIVEANS